MSERLREEFEAWAAEEAEVRGVGETIGLLMDEHHDRYAMIWTQTAWVAWQASRAAAQATIANQAQMIEHLRGGLTPGYTAVDMTTAAAQGFRDGRYPATAWRIIDRKGKRFTVYNEDLADAIAEMGLTVTPMCDVPPSGWECSRDKGHDGPCAATEVGQ